MTLREKLIFEGALVPVDDSPQLPPNLVPPPHGEPVLRLDARARRDKSSHFDGLDFENWFAGRRLAKEEHAR